MRKFGTSFFSWKYVTSSFIQKSIKKSFYLHHSVAMFHSVFKFCFNYKHFFSFSFVVFAWPKAKNPKGSVLTMTTMSGCLPKSLDSNLKMTTRLPSKVWIRVSYPAFFVLFCARLLFTMFASTILWYNIFHIFPRFTSCSWHRITKQPILIPPFFLMIFLSLSSWKRIFNC